MVDSDYKRYYYSNTQQREAYMSEKIKPTSVRIPESLKKKLEQKAKEEGRSFNNLVNRLLSEVVA